MAIAKEMTDYSMRSFEKSLAMYQKLASAKSLPKVMEIQTTHAKSAYEDYMSQMAKIGAMYQNLTKDAIKPLENLVEELR